MSSLDPIHSKGNLELEVSSIAYDSRAVTPGGLFVALRGGKVDGHQFIAEAVKNGACAVLSETEIPTSVAEIVVENTRTALAQVASLFYGEPSQYMKIIGVTGTNGKTTVSFLLEAILKFSGANAGLTGTIQTRYAEVVVPSTMTTPESLDYQKILSKMHQSKVTHVVSEVSSHALFMKRCEQVDYDVGVFTNLSRDHLDFHQNLEAYYQAKAHLFLNLLPASKKSAKVVVNIDDEYGQRLIEDLQIPFLTFSIADPKADFFASEILLDRNGSQAQLKTPLGMKQLKTPLLGSYNIQNTLAALGAAYAMGLDLDRSLQALSQFASVPGRLQTVPNDRGKTVLIDYAHSPDALEKVLKTLRPLVQGNKKLRCLFGCGGDRDRGKRPVMGNLAATLSDWVILTSDNPRTENPLAIIEEIKSGMQASSQNVAIEVDRRKAIVRAIQEMEPGDILLLAGKGHENYQILGDCRISFDDFIIAQDVLKEKPCV